MEKLTSFVFETQKDVFDLEKDYILKGNRLDELRDVNIFVGANNSGKSRILRRIFSQGQLMFPEPQSALSEFVSECEKMLRSNQRLARFYPRTCNLIDSVSPFLGKEFWYFDPNVMGETLRVAIQEIDSAETQQQLTANHLFGENRLNIVLDCYRSRLDDLLSFTPKLHRIYIPILRSLRLTNTDNLLNQTIRDYFNDQLPPNAEIATGEVLYKELQRLQSSKAGIRKLKDQYQRFLSKHFFDGCEATLTPLSYSDSLSDNGNISLTLDDKDNQDHEICYWGDGVQSIICSTYPIFFHIHNQQRKENQQLLVCIEEPELYLHPSMQRKLVEVLMNELSEGVQYFITTHSNHFLDLFLEPEYSGRIAVFSVNPQSDGTRRVTRESNLTTCVYDLLGAQPSSLLLANKTVWVEGVSDRVYLRHAIKLYFERKELEGQKVPAENLDYAFVEYGGANLAHYLEGAEDLDMSALSAHRNVCLLADRDDIEETTKKAEAKRERYKAIRHTLEEHGGAFHVTHGREIENYLTPQILRTLWSELPREVTQKQYLQKKLPAFLSKKGCKKYLNGDSATAAFSKKTDFAAKSIGHQSHWDDLSPEMQELTEALVKFIGAGK